MLGRSAYGVRHHRTGARRPRSEAGWMGKDMWSGCRRSGRCRRIIPAFNPYNYQTGAVWPHDNSL